MIPKLERHCVDFLMKHLSGTNVFGVWERCLKYEISAELLKKCKEVVQTKTNEVLKSDDFLRISLQFLIILLEQEMLSVTEGQLFKSVSFPFFPLC